MQQNFNKTLLKFCCIKREETVEPFQLSIVFHIETSPLFCRVKQMTGFYMKRNTGLKLVKYFGICFKLFHLKEIYHVFVSRILKAGKKAPILVVQHYPEYSTSDRYKDATLVAVLGACEALYVVKHFL